MLKYQLLKPRKIFRYGLTESAAQCTISHPYDGATGHAGYVVPCVEVRLAPVPAMGYTDVDAKVIDCLLTCC